MKDSIVIFTDGASKGNPGPGGWGAVVAAGEMVTELGGREERTTNNRMELRAAIEALSLKSAKPGAPNDTLSVYSDSSYVVNGITTWISGWKRNGWKTSFKKDVENKDLWEKLDSLASLFQIEWIRVAGHADTPGNARADEIASAFGEGSATVLFSGQRMVYARDLSVIGVAKRSKPFYISLIDGKFSRYETWDGCKKAVEGKKGVKYKKVFSENEASVVLARWKEER